MGRGDADFVEFVQAASGRLLHAAYLLTSDRHHAEDVVQTALARCYAAWSRIRDDDAYGYARRTMVNHVIDRWRRPVREDSTEEVPERSVAGGETAVVEREWLMDMLDGLTARERAVVVLRHYFDLPEAAVAAELRVSLGTVKSTNARALGKLRTTAAAPNGGPR
ncbi:RNA polymerase sigma-70 factor, sigma-E family [Actinokineospora alba]|uniref:RNA polymerase sigma-70 factor, sigma-E family n=1 Tax=Actinokineospora alba TaxID=504798 RepID=A0A1H0UR69_9PSEU|nr:SigE family RNA polymerase sigma factor [Actinokineospora alba]TDP69120.1 RNA polymerase sigma-70 factor (sigma-E family) [Actinokineospora alba]SDI80021.1 RNA polymerase sigma-70 factor, sigma-E family [Actinokineospora alba]SDP68610.1 RNA polymerase sigma-70 factor, sigma-E family [Actinokineospora alba]